MRSTKTVHVISAHAEGEVGDVIVGGVTPPMAGSSSICVAAVLIDGGILPKEASGGPVRARAECRGDKAGRIFVQSLPSFTQRLDAPLEAERVGTLTVNTAYGGDSFVIVDAEAVAA